MGYMYNRMIKSNMNYSCIKRSVHVFFVVLDSEIDFGVIGDT